MTDRATRPFEEHYRATMHELRVALTNLLVSAGADPANPQDTARRFDLNRNLTWKVARIVRDPDPFTAYPHLPGAAAIAILLEALGKAGATPSAVAAVVEAAESFEEMIRVHAGDRATLELMLDGLGSDGKSEPLETCRKLAFRGNSGIWGAQAKVRLRTVFIEPNQDDPSALDVAQISGLVNLRRFRPNAVWPLFRQTNFQDDGSPVERRPEPLFGTEARSDEGMLLRNYSSSPPPKVRVIADSVSTIYELADGPLGNHGATTLVYGSVMRRLGSRYRNEGNVFGECIAELNAPSEWLLFDVLVHEDVVDREQPFEVKLFHGESRAFFERRSAELPCNESIQNLGQPPRAATPLFPDYHQLVDDVFERLGSPAEKFRGLRLEMKHPPVPSIAVLRYPLPAAPQDPRFSDPGSASGQERVARGPGH